MPFVIYAISMDRKLLYKSNLMGNSVMRKSRAVKSNIDRSTKRKELFLRGRHLPVSPESETTSEKGKSLKKLVDVSGKKESHKARFMVYMEEKKKRLAMENANKKPPFLSAVVANSSSRKREDHELVVPKPIKATGGTSKNSAIKTKSNQKAATARPDVRKVRADHEFVVPKTMKPPGKDIQSINWKVATKSIHTTAIRNRARPDVQEKKVLSERFACTKKTSNVRNKAESKTNVKNLKLPNTLSVEKQTPLIKDKVSVFNTVGVALTSTARKTLVDQQAELNENFEEILSPIEGIEPLEVDDCATSDPEKNEPPVMIPQENLGAVDLNKTPLNQNLKQENFYMSPFVTTSRGKVSAKKERVNRDSVYKLDVNNTINEPIDVQRRRETVKYFRKVLSEEIVRLQNLCNMWELYHQENVKRIEESCLDMINVAVGQTKLLMTGKLKVFQKLIDNCETLVSTVLPEDVEGYWGATKLQIENVDRRFDNLTQWKNNRWVDPYEKPKPKKNRLAKPLKARKVNRKINPEEKVKILLKKARKDLLKNKINQPESNDCIIFVTKPTLSNRNENNLITPVKRNKPENAVIRQIKTPYRVSLLSKENHTPKINTPSQRRLSVLRNVRTDERYNRSLSLSETPKSSSLRKSILKSETKKSNKKNVLFCDQIQYKSPDSFQKNNSLNASEHSNALDESYRIIQLRTRQVQMNNLDLSG